MHQIVRDSSPNLPYTIKEIDLKLQNEASLSIFHYTQWIASSEHTTGLDKENTK